MVEQVLIQFEGRELFDYQPAESNPKKVDLAFRYSATNNNKLLSVSQILAVFDDQNFPLHDAYLSFPFVLDLDPAVKKPPSFNLLEQKVL
jgi:hypothetical protein